MTASSPPLWVCVHGDDAHPADGRVCAPSARECVSERARRKIDSIFVHVIVMPISVCVEVRVRQQCMRMPVLVSFTRENHYTNPQERQR